MITLSELRLQNKLTQKELADILGISAGAVGMYESGKRVPSLKRAIQISELFGVSVEDIIFQNSTERQTV